MFNRKILTLIKNANAVLRFEETRVIIHSIKSATIKHKIAYTILNENGNSFAKYYALYDNFSHITDIEGGLFDATGKKIKSLKKKDIKDEFE